MIHQPLFIHEQAQRTDINEGPLNGLRHRTVIDQKTGSSELALWQEEHLPGFCVPLHSHDCEEIISVIEGEIEAKIKDECFQVNAGSSILIPAKALHGFRVTSPKPVRLFAIFSKPNPLIYRLDGTESSPPWEGGSSEHLILA